jgi:hypothetical protein
MVKIFVILKNDENGAIERPREERSAAEETLSP